MRLLERLGATGGHGGRVFSFLLPNSEQAMPWKDRPSACPYVLTPDRIPEFCIPPTLAQQPRVSAASHHRSTPNLYLCSPALRRSAPSLRAATLEPRAVGRVAGLTSARKHVIQIDSADETPRDMSCSDDESTNADPRSQAALSLPHLPKAHTSYGFCTLLESPNTRRKESIFHNDPSGAPCLLPRSSTYSLPGNFSTAAMLWPRNLHQHGAWDSDTTSSTESSPFGSPLLSRCARGSSSLFKAMSHDRLFPRAIKKSKTARPRAPSSSTDDGSSTDTSPHTPRRTSAYPTRTGSLSFPFLPVETRCCRERLVRENMAVMDRGGVLRLSVEYCPENERLRVRLISAEGLYGASTEPKCISCCVSLSLLPGKVQKQRSTIIRKSRNPIFNEDFYYDGVSVLDLNTRSLRIKAVNKASTLKRDCILGETELLLMTILSL